MRVHVLGSSDGVPSADRDTSGLAIETPGGWTLIDCPGGVVHKLARIGVGPAELGRLILTHNHVDHVYGLPHLLHAMAIGGHTDELPLAAPEQTLETVREMVATHGLQGSGYPSLRAEAIPMRERVTVAAEDGLEIVASPAAHGRDTVALRFQEDRVAFCHSSDTRPSESVADLARDAQLLLHDCAGLHKDREAFQESHSSALEAAQVAGAAGAEALALFHLGRAAEVNAEALLEEARSAFSGPVMLAADGDVYRLPEEA